MPATLEDLKRFHGFATALIESSDDDWSLQELLDQWQLENSDSSRLHDDVLAVKAAIRDLESGDRGMTFEEHLKKLSIEFDLEPTP